MCSPVGTKYVNTKTITREIYPVGVRHIGVGVSYLRHGLKKWCRLVTILRPYSTMKSKCFTPPVLHPC